MFKIPYFDFIKIKLNKLAPAHQAGGSGSCKTEETVIPAGRRRTGLGWAGQHFSACPAGYQPALKSADPWTCNSRQCTHKDDQNSQDRPKERAETQQETQKVQQELESAILRA